MIEPSLGPDPNLTASAAASSGRKLFRMVRADDSERMAGSVPVWESAEKRHNPTEQAQSFGEILAYETAQIEPAAGNEAFSQPGDEFGFGDLVDMVNPLQHIPVFGHLYREITGDEIKPIAQIMGGALFGGPVGMAGGLVNTIVREETGKDITGNVLALAQADEQIEWKKDDSATTRVAFAPQAPQTPPSSEQSPEARLTRAAQEIENAAYRDLPPALMGFADPGAVARIHAEERPELSAWRARQRYND